MHIVLVIILCQKKKKSWIRIRDVNSILGPATISNVTLLNLQTELRYGLTTSMCVDSEEFWLATGTSDGVVSCWDLRFGLQVCGTESLFNIVVQ